MNAGLWVECLCPHLRVAGPKQTPGQGITGRWSQEAREGGQGPEEGLCRSRPEWCPKNQGSGIYVPPAPPSWLQVAPAMSSLLPAFPAASWAESGLQSRETQRGFSTGAGVVTVPAHSPSLGARPGSAKTSTPASGAPLAGGGAEPQEACLLLERPPSFGCPDVPGETGRCHRFLSRVNQDVRSVGHSAHSPPPPPAPSQPRHRPLP